MIVLLTALNLDFFDLDFSSTWRFALALIIVLALVVFFVLEIRAKQSKARVIAYGAVLAGLVALGVYLAQPVSLEQYLPEQSQEENFHMYLDNHLVVWYPGDGEIEIEFDSDINELTIRGGQVGQTVENLANIELSRYLLPGGSTSSKYYSFSYNSRAQDGSYYGSVSMSLYDSGNGAVTLFFDHEPLEDHSESVEYFYRHDLMLEIINCFPQEIVEIITEQVL